MLPIVTPNILTLEEFTIKEMRSFPRATGQLAGLLRDIGLAAKRINAGVNRAGLADILGNTGNTNVHGEEVKKLDEYAHIQMAGVLKEGINCAAIASEETDDIITFDNDISRNSKYVCMFDPLDGSSNIDVNISIGTIFSVYRRVTERGTPVTLKDFLQPGTRQVAAGYILYGSSTILVYATKRGVNGFTLDPAIGEFSLSHPGIRCAEAGFIYSVNQANHFCFDRGVQKYIHSCEGKRNTTGIAYTLRYTGSLVADIHRNLIKGGIFIYPGSAEKPQGKLRLLYECNPLAYIMEVAGGVATDGCKRILEKIPKQLHERTPFFTGSRLMMEELESFIRM